MATSSVPNANFVNGTSADADQVDANFAALVAFDNGSVVHRDGTKAMTAAFDAGGFKVSNAAAATAAADVPRFDQSGFGDCETTGSGVTIGTSATTVDSVSVTLPGASLALVLVRGSVTSSGVSYPVGGGSGGENATATVTFTVTGVTTSDTTWSSVVFFGSNTTTQKGIVFLVSLPSGASTINLQAVRANDGASGGTITADTGFKLAVIGAF